VRPDLPHVSGLGDRRGGRLLAETREYLAGAGRTGVSYSDHYEERGLFQQLMDRLRAIAGRGPSFGPVVAAALT
jgi:hypothetical protein